MTVVQSFPLIKLPSVAFNEVISFMNPINQVCLSFASKSTKKMMYKKQKLSLEVVEKDRQSAYQIVCKNKNGLKLLKITINSKWQENFYNSNWNINDQIVPVHREKGILRTYWKDETEGYQKMTSFLCNVFKIQNYSISFFFRSNNSYSKIVKHLQKLKSELKINISKIKVKTVAGDKKHYILEKFDILEKFKDVPELSIDTFGMRYQHNDIESETNKCTIEYAYWRAFNSMNLLIKCKEVRIWKFKWTPQEVNQFIRTWMESSMMEKVYLNVENVEYQMAVNELPVTPIKLVLKVNGGEGIPAEGFKIQRHDGVKALIYMWQGAFQMHPWLNF